mmetsp:Transcript_37038/g.106907  ORF Transcript_37038/g.106907 Transcript_37038/m.106907 type:complete len:602 (+) Transcript_37038:79-1884(+)
MTTESAWYMLCKSSLDFTAFSRWSCPMEVFFWVLAAFVLISRTRVQVHSRIAERYSPTAAFVSGSAMPGHSKSCSRGRASKASLSTPWSSSSSAAVSASATSVCPISPLSTIKCRRKATACAEPASIQLLNSSKETSPLPSVSMSFMTFANCFGLSLMPAPLSTALISLRSRVPLPFLSTLSNMACTASSTTSKRAFARPDCADGRPSLPAESFRALSMMRAARLPFKTSRVAFWRFLIPFAPSSARAFAFAMMRWTRSMSKRERIQMPSAAIFIGVFCRARIARISFVKRVPAPLPMPLPPMRSRTFSTRPASAAKWRGVRLSGIVWRRSAFQSDNKTLSGPGPSQAAAQWIGYKPLSVGMVSAVGSIFSNSPIFVPSGHAAAKCTGVMLPKRNFAVTDLLCKAGSGSSFTAARCATPAPKAVNLGIKACRMPKRPYRSAGSTNSPMLHWNGFLELPPHHLILPRRQMALSLTIFRPIKSDTWSAESGERPMTRCMGSGFSFGSTRALLSSRPPLATPILPVSKPSIMALGVPVPVAERLLARPLPMLSRTPFAIACWANKLMHFVSAFSMAKWNAVCLLTTSRWQNSGTEPTTFCAKNS